MPSKSKNTGRAAAGKTITVRLPPSMLKLLTTVGNKIYTPARAGKRRLNPKYAQTVCMILADNDLKEAARLQSLAEQAYRDFRRVGGPVEFAP